MRKSLMLKLLVLLFTLSLTSSAFAMTPMNADTAVAVAADGGAKKVAKKKATKKKAAKKRR